MIKKFVIFFLIFIGLIESSFSKILPTFVQEETNFIGAGEKTSGIAISPDGTKIFVTKFNDGSDISLYQYTLDTAFDISSKNAGSEEKLALNPAGDPISNQTDDITFNNDGTKLFAISDNGAMNIHILSTPYDISDATLVADDGINWRTYKEPWGSSNTTMLPQTIRFNNDGTKMYLTEAVINTTDPQESVGVVQYNLATPFVPSSTTTVQVLNLRAQFPKTNIAIHAMNFDDDGTRMYVSAGNFNAETDHPHAVYELSIPFEISSAKHVGTFNFVNASGGGVKAVGGVFSEDGNKYYMTTGDGDSVVEYTLTCPFGLVICESEAEAETVTSAQVKIAKNLIHHNTSTIFKRFDWLKRNEGQANLNSHNINFDININNPVLVSLKNHLENTLKNHLENSLTNNEYILASLKKEKPENNNRNWSYWSHGDISVGRVGNDDVFKTREIKTKGFMVGADKLINNRIFGYAFRYGDDDVDVNSDINNELNSQSFTLNLYGSIPLKGKSNLNALIGASYLSMDQLASGKLTGDRNGKQIFTSMSYVDNNMYTEFDLIPFGKFEIGYTQLSNYTDFYSASEGVETHEDLSFRTTNVSAGLKFDNILYLDNKTLSRNGFIEYIHDLTPNIDYKYTNQVDNVARQKTIKKHSMHNVKGNLGFEYVNVDGYTVAINYEIFQSLDESARTDSLLFKLGKNNKQYANLNIIYQPMNNNNAAISYFKKLGSLDLKVSSNYSLFSNIPDYGANIELSGTF